ncbi:GH92 family glycosyl hydrolase [Brachybacterium tyrofermentans]|uniref:GH92 family glycosyl hydrolase n=1 Tax=Brachybacterium TaxID=43668 RepID=UPI0018694D69|nr:GH92 family glycosyl hydrolase [Brachybacterium sp. FME24]
MSHRRLVPFIAFAAALSLAAPLATAAPTDEASPADSVDLVNPFIGSQAEGNTFPGASLPFGMVQLSPDTGHYAGYRYTDDRIRGFSMTHVSGVGCGLGGDLPMTPMTGRPDSTDYGQYAQRFRHETESASPGSYQVTLDDPDGAVTAELTATTRTGQQRLTYEGSEESGLMLNAGQALHGMRSSKVEVLDDRTIRTTVEGSGFCQETEPYTLHFLTTFDRDIETVDLFDGDEFTAASTDGSAVTEGEARQGAWIGFDTTQDQDVEVTTSLSWVDADGAAGNLAEEGGRSFDEVRDAARSIWQERLDAIMVEGGSEEQRRTFYSSLYRSLLGPHRGDDVDGRYLGWDDEVHTADGHGYYQTSSLWDTYRTQIQLLALIAPQEARDQSISLILQGEQSGRLPRWGWGPVETNVMTGDPVTPQLVTSQQYGLLEGWEDRLWTQLVQNADTVPSTGHPANGRAGNDHYLEHGYVPAETGAECRPGDCDLDHAGSATMEYAVADAAMSVLAEDLGHEDDALRYAERSRSWESIINPDTGFPQPRDADGVFVGDPDPAFTKGFHEGTSWQYNWLVPQDVPGLIAKIGGTEATNERLDSFFAYDQLLADPEGTARDVWVNSAYDYYGTSRYNPQNEPDLHAPYLYLWTGQPWKSPDVVRAALTLFSDNPSGITGNDDVGTMSAWHVLSSLGIYPAIAGTDVLTIGSPIFDRAVIDLPEPFYDGDLVIEAPGTSQDARYVQQVELDGRTHRQSWLTSADLRDGADLDIDLGTEPSDWATRRGEQPPTPVPGRGERQLEDLGAALTTDAPLTVVSGEETTIDATVSAVLTGRGEITADVALTSDDAVAVTPEQGELRVQGDGSPQRAELPVTLTVPADAPAGEHTVTATVTSRLGTVESELVVQVLDTGCEAAGSQCIVPLEDALTLDGVATLEDPSAGDFDGKGWAFAGDELPAPGEVPVDDVVMRIPSTEGTDPNLAVGPFTVEVGQLTQRLTLLATARNGDTSDVPLTLTYADGSAEETTVSVGDWAGGSPSFDNRPGLHQEYRIENGVGRVGPETDLWLLDVPTDPTRELASITVGDEPDLAVMAVTAQHA